MPISGAVSELPIQDIAQILNLNRKTGVLIVEKEEPKVGELERAKVYFLDGEVKFVSANWGKRLEEAAAAVGYPVPPDLRGEEVDFLVEVLSRDEPLKPKVLAEARRLTEERMGELLTWDRGEFSFVERELPEVLSEMEVGTTELIMQAARYADEIEYINRELPSMEVVPAFPEKLPPSPLRLDPGEWKVLAHVDGRKSVREIASEVPGGILEVARSVISLKEKGVIVLKEKPAEEADTFPTVHRLLLRAYERLEMGDYKGAEDLAVEALSLDPGLVPAHLLLAEIYFASGRYIDAYRRYREAVKREPGLAKKLSFHIACALIAAGKLEWAEGYLRMSDHPGARELRELHGRLNKLLREKPWSFEEI